MGGDIPSTRPGQYIGVRGRGVADGLEDGIFSRSTDAAARLTGMRKPNADAGEPSNVDLDANSEVVEEQERERDG